MRAFLLSLLTIGLLGCAGIETEPADTEDFASRNYQTYAWRRPALSVKGSGLDSIYRLDPVVRETVDAELIALGYRRVEEAGSAGFLVDYIAASGMSMGVVSNSANNVSAQPSAVMNRNMDQAAIDNAYALGGVKETANIGILFIDRASDREVWRVGISKIIEDTNTVNTDMARRAIRKGLKTLPAAPQ